MTVITENMFQLLMLNPGGGGIEARPGTEKRFSHNLQNGPVKTWTAVFVTTHISDRHRDQLLVNSFQTLCVFCREKVSGERLISYRTYCQFRTREHSMAATSMKTPVFALSCLLQWRVDQLRAVRQSRFACLYLENRFATNVSKLKARIR